MKTMTHEKLHQAREGDRQTVLTKKEHGGQGEMQAAA